jgi:hypothetical protein
MADQIAKQYINYIFIEAEGCHAAIVLKTIATFKRLYRCLQP